MTPASSASQQVPCTEGLEEGRRKLRHGGARYTVGKLSGRVCTVPMRSPLGPASHRCCFFSFVPPCRDLLVNNGSFLPRPQSAGISSHPWVPSGASRPAHSQEESGEHQDRGPERPAPAAHPPALLLVHAAPAVPAAAAAAEAASHQRHEDDEQDSNGHADEETQLVEQQLG